MISRCPSCGVPAPDEARQCQGCGWDFVANKKGDKSPPPPKKPEPGAEKPKPAPAPPPSSGFSLPPARGGASGDPASGLGMAKLPKVEPGGSPAPGAAEENPFALPVARNLGPKPGESLFSSPPPPPAEPKLPEAKPKHVPEPEEAADEKPAAPEPLSKAPAPIAEAGPAPKPAVPAAEDVPPAKIPPRKVEPPRKVPPPDVPADVPAEDEEDVPSAALALPSSKKEIIVEPVEKGAGREPLEPEPVKPPSKVSDKDQTDAKPAKARPSAVYLAALAGGVLGLFSVGAIFMMIRSEPTPAARPTGASPFGKRAAGDATMTPVLEDGSEPAAGAPSASPPSSPVPAAPSDIAHPTSIPAPAVSRAVEPPSPAGAAPAPPPAPVPAPAPPPAAVAPAPAARTPMPSAPASVAPKAPEPARATSSLPQVSQPKPVPPAPAAKPKPAAAPAPKKAAGPQWVFEGVVYDLLTTRGAFGVRLVFVDAEDNEVASAETREDGQYRVAMRPGPAEGYSLRIVHEDYSGKHIDELDSTSSVRKADLEQRKFLMQAGARSLPWIGTVGKAVRRDMALVPRASVE